MKSFSKCYSVSERIKGSKEIPKSSVSSLSLPATLPPLSSFKQGRKLAQGPLSSQALTCEHVLGVFLLHYKRFGAAHWGLVFFFFLKELCVC